MNKTAEYTIYYVEDDTSGKIYITSNKNVSTSYQTSGAFGNNWLFDGVASLPTARSDFNVLPAMPSRVEKKGASRRINLRWERVSTAPHTLPVFVEWDQEATYNGDEDNEYKSFLPLEYQSVRDAYTPSYDLEEAEFEELNVEWTKLGITNGVVPRVIPSKAVYSFFTEVTTHPAFRADEPVALTSEESYKLIREYVKQHIDLRYASITSDYDFCLSVEKVIKLAEPESYTIDANFSLTRKSRKPKYETRYRHSRKVVVFACAPNHKRDGVYKGYKQCVTFSGNNWDNLQENVNNYLTALMLEINAPLIDCAHCRGMGVILMEESKPQ